MTRQHREAIGADFVRKIAIGADPIRPDENDIHLRLPHQRRRGGVGDQRGRNAGMHQLPRGET